MYPAAERSVELSKERARVVVSGEAATTEA